MLRIARHTGRLLAAPRALEPSFARTAPAFYQIRHKTDWGKSWRRFWGSDEAKEESKGDKNSAKEVEPIHDAAAAPESAAPKSELVSTYGDDAPKVSPLVILPVMRHPIFPGFMVVLSDLPLTLLVHFLIMPSFRCTGPSFTER